jgi:hypothetical protein
LEPAQSLDGVGVAAAVDGRERGKEKEVAAVIGLEDVLIELIDISSP